MKKILIFFKTPKLTIPAGYVKSISIYSSRRRGGLADNKP
jgi:hypothetical protein